MSKPLHVLIVEDSEADTLLLLRELRSGDYDVTFERVETRDELIVRLDKSWDIILSDYSMPNFSGRTALQLVRERGLDVPFIVISGTIGEDALVQLLHAGASDFVTKDRIARLTPAIERALREVQDHHQRRWAEEALRQSEERFAKAFRATPVGLTISTSADNHFIDVNDRAAEILGYSRDELLGKTALELGIWVNPQDRDRAGQILAQGQTVRSMETQFRTRSGEIRDALISIDIVEIAGERCVLSMVDDITERKRAEQARAHLAAIIASSSDAIMSSTLNAIITSWNAAAERMYGYTADEAIGKPTTFLLPFDRSNEEADMLRQLAAGQPVESFETVRLRKDGTPIHISLTISPIRDSSGSVIGASTIARDMSERKLAEEALRRHNARLEMIHRIDHAILAAQSTQAIAQAAMQHIQPLVPCHRASVATYDFDKNEATVVATTAAWDTPLGAGVSFPLTPSEPVEVLRQGRIFSVEDLLNRTQLVLAEREALIAEGVRSYIAVPLMVRGALIGSLNLGSEQADAFLPDHMSIAHEVANQLAIALENARLLETERRHRSELEALRQASLHLTTNLELQPVLRAILDHAIELMAADDTHIFLFDGERLVFGAAIWGGSHQEKPYAEPRSDGLTYTVARSGEMIVIPYVNRHPLYRDWRWGGSIVGLPLCVGARVNGVMTMAFARPHTFQDHELRVLELLADQAAIAIQNAQLYEEVQHYAEELEQRVAERTAQLRQTKEHVEAILNNSSDAIIFARRDSLIQQINPAFVELLGYEADDVFGKPLTLLAVPEQVEPLAEALRGVELTNKSSRVEITAYRRDGSTFDADVALSPVENAHTWGIVCSLRDITQRKRAEEELRSALEKEKEVSDLKSRFTSMVSHEFRTPLATIQTSSDLLKSYSQRMTDEQKMEYLNTIQAQVKHLTELLEDILTIGEVAVGLQFEPKRMDVDAFCRNIAAEMELSVNNTHSIQVSSRGDCANVLLDEKLLQRILTNLISNAIKYSPQGGSVFVSLSCDRGATAISVKDQGIGIPEEDQARLFEAFHRAKNVSTISGTGLGLSIVKRAVELHGGSIHLESEVGVGTTFTVTIPTVEQQD